MDDYPQKATGAMTYPTRGTLNRILFKTPLIWWRSGLGPMLGRKMLVLTTWGRKSSLPRHSMLSYTTVGGIHYVIAGWGARSDWAKNITTNPRVTVQTDRDTYTTTARRVTTVEEYGPVMQVLLGGGGDSHFEPWLESLNIDQNLDDLIAKRDRVYLIALDRSDEPGPPPMKTDLIWLWPAMIGAAVIGWLVSKRRH